MKLEKSKVNVKLTEDEKKALRFLTHKTDLQCIGIICRECPFNKSNDLLHPKCIYKKFTLLANDLLNIVEGSR